MRRVAGFLIVMTAACGGTARVPIERAMGPDPVLPPPRTSTIPVVRVAPAIGWSGAQTPAAAPGLAVDAFARNLDHPRWLHVLPNGDVLVAETNAPADRKKRSGPRAFVTKHLFKLAGGAVPSADRITLLRDADRDGVAETRVVLIDSLYAPFGMALVGETLYVANSNMVLAFPYRVGELSVRDGPEWVVDLPAGRLNHHWTKSLVASADGTRLYVGVGSNSNVAERGMEAERDRAAILEVDPRSHRYRVFASGLRNPVGLAWEPTTRVLWTVVNERDELGSDLVPDYLTSVREGGFYGWPYSYYGAHVDARVQPEPALVATSLVPDYALGSHTGSLGLAWSADNTLPAAFGEGMFVGQHGSWNRRPFAGYQVIFVPFRNGRPTGELPITVLSGFLDELGRAHGRPVGVAVHTTGALLVADDVGNVIWRVTARSTTARR